ncbi:MULTISPECIES: Gfo/Idh/MocA family protein [Francisella]|uniref:Gfo/Idh/MocA family protein n=1 Tax=Francisella TaxID=262 RepID=UPI001C55933D|nr:MULTISPECIES: Gfo/Idh/MocA family oxidoreductase [Francisella]
MTDHKDYKEPLRLAFIGGGVNSAIGYTHYIASQMDHLFVVVSGCFSRNPEINKLTAQKWGIEDKCLYECWKDLLECEVGNVDAVVILTPTPTHYDVATYALDLGYNVICEKALASNVDQGKKIAEKVENKKAFFAITHNYTGYPMLRELQAMIQEGKLGKIININIEMPQESFIRFVNGEKPQPQQWRLQDETINGVSLDLGTHLQHMVYFLTGENPIELVADTASYGHFSSVIDNVACLARYQSGMKSQMLYGKSFMGHRNGLRVRVYGDQGSAEWFQMNPEDLMFYSIDGNRIVIDRASPNVCVSNQSRYNRFKAGHPAGFVEAFGNLYFDISEQLRKFKVDGEYAIDWSYGVDQALAGLQVFEAIEESALNRQWISLGEVIVCH